MNDECIEEMNKSIKINNSMKVMDFSHNNLEDQGAKILINIASKFVGLTLLDYSILIRL